MFNTDELRGETVKPERNDALLNTILIAGVFSLGVSAIFTIVRFVSFVAADIAGSISTHLHTSGLMF